MKKSKPILAITMGDPAGIGPEIAVKTFANKEVYDWCSPVLVGSAAVMDEAMKIAGTPLLLNPIQKVEQARFEFGKIDVLDIGMVVGEIKYGEVSAEAGNLAFYSIVKAIELAKNGEVDGTVTNPINKKAINDAGHHFSGHTEIYAHYTDTSKYAMLLADEKIKVIHVSTHVSLRKACDLAKKERILEVIDILNKGLKRLGIDSPRIGVAGLNPHSGDDGLFGDEEIKEIGPAVVEAKQKGLDVSGPVPPDTLFALAAGGRFDGCVAMYHDQGHIPFKLAGFQWDEETKKMKSVKGVNITLGLPIIRTSVDHGTAFEIAGQGIASPDALMYAINYAVKLAQN
ncbi:4-hydroxythreonine-4-phosphate dehydrogenase PdxA [uncultured Draconibacterium sp.]|uniref:4-hydroxythreonine-4-phosphate dehydrogenase PdxA n=1 Tax=uncultured Draconibacterium sp. TaxID=1573823 RepID=UPI0025D68F31|nr:4-hydroxythreonine-4-phosphate dehydrogenase PdxA [uncultured Draconibacterium sp.]